MTKKPHKEKTPDKATQLEDQLKRTLADMENLRRRLAEERLEITKQANAALLTDLLPTLDNFTRAFTAADTSDPSLQGFQKIHDSLLTTLEKHNLQKMHSLGEKFNPQKHNALTTTPGAQDEITEVFEEGYTLGNTILRHAKVSIGDGSKK